MRQDSRLRRFRNCSIESLEPRQVLSGSSLGSLADIRMHPLIQTMRPMQSTSPVGLTPAQVRKAYNFDNILFNGGIKGNGAGMTIAIVDAFQNPTIANDLKVFDKTFGIPDPPSFKIVNQTGSTTRLPPTELNFRGFSTGWAIETALDVEWAHAIAPAANILLVEAASDLTTDLLTGVDFARKQAGVVVVSNSWGGAEGLGEGFIADSFFTTPSGHAPVTFVFSAGDNGGPATYPSASPNVVSVGGTKLTLDANNNWADEVVWNERLLGFGAGGGGLSQITDPATGNVFPLETLPNYQLGLGLTSRGTPDVSYNGDPLTGFAVYSASAIGTGAFGGWEAIGGTSAGAPQWAGIMAIANQGRVALGKKTLSNPQSVLYKLPAADFHDITVGDNDYIGAGLGITGNAAGPGYDLASGRGTPIANLVIRDLVAFNGTTYVSATPRGPATTSDGIWYFMHRRIGSMISTASPASTIIGQSASNLVGTRAAAALNSVATTFSSNAGSLPTNAISQLERARTKLADVGTTLHSSHAKHAVEKALSVVDGIFGQFGLV